MNNIFFLFFSIVFVFITNTLNAKTITIGNNGDYLKLSDAQHIIVAGDTILILDQIFEDGAQFLNGLMGTVKKPIVIIAKNQHKAIFRGGSEAIHLVKCKHVELNGFIFERQTANGVNIDDGGTFDTPSIHITIRNCIFRDMNASGNNDLLKMSGIDSFLIENCSFINGGAGGSGIDFVGCHYGIIQDCLLDNSGSSGIQNKGGTQHIRIQRNRFKNISQRALNLGGSTSLAYFRPPLPDPIVDAFEASDIEVYSNVFTGCLAPIAYVGCVNVKVYNNTFYNPENWVIRILQETTVPGFLTCADNEFINNIVYIDDDIRLINIGPNTNPGSFKFSNNLWFNASSNTWSPRLPVTDHNQLLADPLFQDAITENYELKSNSPAIMSGLELSKPITDFNQFKFKMERSIGAFEGDKTPTSLTIKRPENIHIYPNPCYGEEINVEGLLDKAEILIYNKWGQVLTNYIFVQNGSVATISNLEKGVYFIHVETNNKLIIKKLIVL